MIMIIRTDKAVKKGIEASIRGKNMCFERLEISHYHYKSNQIKSFLIHTYYSILHKYIIIEILLNNTRYNIDKENILVE